MELAHRWRDRNLTRMELTITIFVLALLLGSFSRYALIVFAQAERSMINRTVMNINTALKYRASIAVLRSNYDELRLLLSMNPMEMVQAETEANYLIGATKELSSALVESSLTPPSNYGGIIYKDDQSLMEKGKWYFQPIDKLLIYRIRNSEFFISDLENSDRIRFRTKLIYEDKNGNEQYDEGIDDYKSLKIQSIDRYLWNI